MSDAVKIELIRAVFPFLGLVLTGVLGVWLAKINRNVKEYHKEVNGKMAMLLESKESESIAKQETAKVTGEKTGAEHNQALTDAKPQELK